MIGDLGRLVRDARTGAAVLEADRPNGLGDAGEPRPEPERLEHALRAVHQRESAAGESGPERRIDRLSIENDWLQSEALERKRQKQAGVPTTGDQDPRCRLGRRARRLQPRTGKRTGAVRLRAPAVPLDAALEQRNLQLLECPMLDLPHPLLADPEVASQLLQRPGIVAQPPLLDDRLLAIGQLGKGLGQPDRARPAVAREHHGLFWGRPLVGEEVLPLVLAGRTDRSIERLVAAGQAHLHRLDLVGIDRQLRSDESPARLVERAARAVADLGAQPAQIEEQRLLRRGRAGAHHGPVPEDVVLHGGADPPRRIGRETDLPLRLEPSRRLHQARRRPPAPDRSSAGHSCGSGLRC